MQAFNAIFPHLQATPGNALEVNIGRTVRYVLPKDRAKKAAFLRQHGTVARDSRFTIIGTQKDYAGRLCYRAQGIDFPDSFGRGIAPELVEFI